MTLDLEKIKTAARAADQGVWSIGESTVQTDGAYIECTMDDGSDPTPNLRFIGIAGNPRTVLALVRQLELERGMRLQCAEDSQMHLDRALAAEARYRFVIEKAELLDHGRGQNHWTLTSVVFDQAGEQDLGGKHAEITAAVDAGLKGASHG